MRGEGKVGPGRWVLFWSIALGGTIFDLSTKSYIFSRIGPPPAPPVAIVPRILEWHTSQNTGALWGFGANIPGSSLIFAGLSVIAGIIICYYLFMLGAASSRVLTVALGLIMAGAMGNCYDRLALGHVRDFVHFHVDAIGFDCAIFNFADNMLIIGAFTLVVYALRPENSHAATSSANEQSGAVDAHPVEETMRHAAGPCPSPPSQSIHTA
jgi:signal peptidase II